MKERYKYAQATCKIYIHHPEITWLLKSLEYKTIDIFGARLGAFSREHTLKTDDYEMLKNENEFVDKVLSIHCLDTFHDRTFIKKI